MTISVEEGGKAVPRTSGKGCCGQLKLTGVEGQDRGMSAVSLQALLRWYCKKTFTIHRDQSFLFIKGEIVPTRGIFTHVI